MRVIIAGSRTFTDYHSLSQAMDHLMSLQEDPITVICGGARGADTLGKHWALARGHAVEEYPADWDGLGRRAGHVRNAQMADAYPDALVLFWDMVSPGSAGMKKLAEERGIETVIFDIS